MQLPGELVVHPWSATAGSDAEVEPDTQVGGISEVWVTGSVMLLTAEDD